jgi:hypothetical protein
MQATKFTSCSRNLILWPPTSNTGPNKHRNHGNLYNNKNWRKGEKNIFRKKKIIWTVGSQPSDRWAGQRPPTRRMQSIRDVGSWQSQENDLIICMYSNDKFKMMMIYSYFSRHSYSQVYADFGRHFNYWLPQLVDLWWPQTPDHVLKAMWRLVQHVTPSSDS